MIGVLRLGHRVGRDERATTHVCLVARAFGAGYVAFCGMRDEGVLQSARRLQEKWGGEVEFEYRPDWRGVVDEWKGRGAVIVHLTMYGLPIQEVLGRIMGGGRDMLVIVGGEKVPPEVYKLADWNVAITSQPHSEIAALAVFLDRYFEGAELGLEFGGGVRIEPSKCGKNVKICK